MKNILLIIAYLFIFICCSQNSSISGTVIDFNDKQSLIGVNIVLKSISQETGTSTDFDGKFKFEDLENGEYQLTISYIGYKTQNINISITKPSNTQKDIMLKTESSEMDVIVISAGKFEQKLEEVTVSMDIIKPSLIENKNTPDLEVLMNQSPGVQVVDGQANIRGGSGWSYNTGSRVLVMIDDMPLLSGDRGTVEWSMIPMENISQIEVIKGASSVLFGSSALNGVINVRTSYPKGEPELKASIFSGIYDTPHREGLHWWGDNTRHFHGMNFSYAQHKNNTGLVLGGNIYSNDGYRGGIVSDSSANNFGELIPVSEKWARINFNTEHNSSKYPGLTYGINGNFTYMKQYQSIIFASDSIGYTPINVPQGTIPALFTQLMFNIDPHIKYVNPNNNTKYSYKARFFRDDYKPFEEEIGYSDVLYQELQFQKTVKKQYGHIVSTSGLTSNYIKGDYDEVYGEGGDSKIKQLFNYSAYSQFDFKYKKLNYSFGARLEHLVFQDESLLIPVLRTGLNYQLAEGTFLRSSFGQGYRYPTIMELFVKTDYDPVYVYSNPDLNPESGWSSEIGLKQLFKIGGWKGMFDVAGFMMQYNDMIEFTFGNWAAPSTPNPADNFYGIGFKCVNIGETRMSGVEVSAIGDGKIGKFDISLLASYTYVNPIILDPDRIYYEYEQVLFGDTIVNQLNYGTVDLEEYLVINGDSVTNPNYNPLGASYDNSNGILKYRQEHLVKFDINVEYKNFMSGLSIRYNSFMQNMDAVFGSALFNDNGVGTAPGGEALINLSIINSRNRSLEGDLIIDWRIGLNINENLTASFVIDNVLNREYQIRPADIGPPRAYTLKLSGKF